MRVLTTIFILAMTLITSLKCFLKSAEDSNCELADLFCLERDTGVKPELHKCVAMNCTIREELSAKNFSSYVHGEPVRDQTRFYSYTAIISGGFALLAVITRISVQLPYLGGAWGPDDWTILLAMIDETQIPAVSLNSLSVLLAKEGLGKDMWTVPFDSITHILRLYYWAEICYVSSTALVKVSILLFYLRTFPNRILRRYVKLTIAAVVLYMLAFVPTTIVQCLPIQTSWERWDGEHQAKCINLNMLAWVGFSVDTFINIAVICLPLRELSKLPMDRSKTAGVMLMFMLGGVGTIVSALRLKWTVQFGSSKNATWDYTPIGYFSNLEIQVGIVLACLPAFRTLQRRLFSSEKSADYYIPPTQIYGEKGSALFLHSHSSIPELGGKTVTARNSSHCCEHFDDELLKHEASELGINDVVPSNPKKGTVEIMGRGVDHKDIKHGSTHSTESIFFLLEAPAPAYTRNNLRRGSSDDSVPLQAQIITVRKATTVARNHEANPAGSSVIPRPPVSEPRSPKDTSFKAPNVKVFSMYAPSLSEEALDEMAARRKSSIATIEEEFRTLSLARYNEDVLQQTEPPKPQQIQPPKPQQIQPPKLQQIQPPKPQQVQPPELHQRVEQVRRSEDGDASGEDDGFWG
ncbi:hypothetical protein K504DRAFT_515165 [Pleomassaria siparia CBS 279.74]|uniref:Uncharacterized protein n=1 Tax=Pleomassaria siparia CBS 279.74 TaxID=1314801 RepID=A0A6G1JXE3_9PLEO|nr:hypothetical protein K504DRAFT_515165 [Pleomassaria siparia CBS 279.74]